MEFHKNHAIYLQIGDHICDNILSKKWDEGDRIPSVREMAVSIEVNPNTVMRTYAYLQEAGILVNQRGIGYFVAEDAYERTRKLKREEFIAHELPRLFKAVDLLALSFDDLKQRYEAYRAELAAKEEL